MKLVAKPHYIGKITIREEPKAEGPRITFDDLVHRTRKLIYDLHAGKIRVARAVEQGDYTIAAAKTFAAQAYEMLKVEGIRDMETYNWAHNPNLGNEQKATASVHMVRTIGRVLKEMRETAPNTTEHFYALQNIYDVAVQFNSPHLAYLVLMEIDQVPRADISIVCRNIEDYVKMRGRGSFEQIRRGVYKREGISAILRAVSEKLETVIHGNQTEQDRARKWLDDNGCMPGE